MGLSPCSLRLAFYHCKINLLRINTTATVASQHSDDLQSCHAFTLCIKTLFKNTCECSHFPCDTHTLLCHFHIPSLIYIADCVELHQWFTSGRQHRDEICCRFCLVCTSRTAQQQHWGPKVKIIESRCGLAVIAQRKDFYDV